MNFEHLKTQEIPTLKELAGKMGLQVHHRAGKDKIIKAIMEASLLPQVQTQPQSSDHFKGEDMRPKAVKPRPAEFDYSEADVREACAASFSKPGFNAEFPGDGTVIFKCRGAEDSVNLKQPMKVIKRKAETVALGRFMLMGHTDFDSINATGKNAYTNTVLS